jgi:hypothetical protein
MGVPPLLLATIRSVEDNPDGQIAGEFFGSTQSSLADPSYDPGGQRISVAMGGR